MSLINRWMKKYYAETASECINNMLDNGDDWYNQTEKTKLEVMIEATKHSIIKWQGLCELDRFNESQARNYDTYLKVSSKDLVELWVSNNDYKDWMTMDASSCSLCELAKVVSLDDYLYCYKCPIFLTVGNSCDNSLTDDYDIDEDSFKNIGLDSPPYDSFSLNSDPLPMLKTLLVVYARLYAEYAGEISSNRIPCVVVE